jgi:hypothetical protein
MENNINIVAILEDKPTRTKLYSPLYGEVFLSRLVSNNGIRVLCKGLDGSLGTDEKSFFGNGKFTLGGEICLFPSKEMRDWEKFAWKKGDVLFCGFNNLCIFEKWANIEYTEFEAKFATPNYRSAVLKTEYWSKTTTESLIKQHISKIEKIKGGKLNISTLEIEKQPEFKEGDIVALMVQKCTHIAIFQSRQETYIGFHAVLCNNEQLLLEEPFREDDGDIELRPATDSEKQQLFDALAKEGKAWDSDKKQIVDLPKKFEFKPFDKVLCRNSKDDTWEADFFARLTRKEIDYTQSDKYLCVGDLWMYCIPYNEETAHLLGTTDDWEGGEQ